MTWRDTIQHPIALSTLVAIGILACPSAEAAAQPRCGVERWAVKTGADAEWHLVDSIPIPTTVAELVQIPRPSGPFANDARVAPIERQTFLLRARLVRVIAEDDSDFHIVIRDLEIDSLTMVVELPAPDCTSNPALVRPFTSTRSALRGVPRRGVIEIVGVGFFDFQHGQSGMAANGLELHPVTSLRLVTP